MASSIYYYYYYYYCCYCYCYYYYYYYYYYYCCCCCCCYYYYTVSPKCTNFEMLFSVSDLKDKKLIKKQTYVKTETCKLGSRVF